LDNVVIGHESTSETGWGTFGEIDTDNRRSNSDRHVEDDLADDEDPILTSDGRKGLDEGTDQAEYGEKEEGLLSTISLVEPWGDLACQVTFLCTGLDGLPYNPT
jgi:hypothetical protein